MKFVYYTTIYCLGQLLLLSMMHGSIKRVSDETVVQLDCVDEVEKFCRAWKISDLKMPSALALCFQTRNSAF